MTWLRLVLFLAFNKRPFWKNVSYRCWNVFLFDVLNIYIFYHKPKMTCVKFKWKAPQVWRNHWVIWPSKSNPDTVCQAWREWVPFLQSSLRPSRGSNPRPLTPKNVVEYRGCECRESIQHFCLLFIEKIERTVQIEASTVEIEERGVKLRLTVVDTPGYGDAINSQDWYVYVPWRRKGVIITSTKCPVHSVVHFFFFSWQLCLNFHLKLPFFHFSSHHIPSVQIVWKVV